LKLKLSYCYISIVLTVVYKDVLCKLVKWNEDSLKCQLPLVTSTSGDVSVTVFGLSDFMSADQHTCMSTFCFH